MTEPYTRYPRPTMWLVRGDEAVIGDDVDDRAPSFSADVASFYISKTPVTNLHYEAYDPQHERCEASAGDDHPVVNVSFDDALGYCAWYARISNKLFRLPSEVEWELACRAGKRSRWFFGANRDAADRFVWHAENSGGRARPVEQLRANPYGLHEMLGNVWEWTASRYAPYPFEAGDDRDAPQPPGKRVARGGSFRQPLERIGASVRCALDRDARRDDLGFRIARTL